MILMSPYRLGFGGSGRTQSKRGRNGSAKQPKIRWAVVSLKAGHPNQIFERKRPLHTIIPGMIGQKENIVGSFGVMGGHYQAAGHAFILSQILDFCLSQQCALDLPRIFPNNGTLDIEENFDLDLIEELKNKGHIINYPALPIGGGQIIVNDIDNGISIGASDWRKDGIALGL